MKETNIKEGFIITRVDGRKVKLAEETANPLKDTGEQSFTERCLLWFPGVYYYGYGL